LTSPLAVRWAPERGEIVLDHNKSAEIWRRETGAGTAAPPFGAFIRVDDLVSDALWCWPGVIDAHFNRLVEDGPPPSSGPDYRLHNKQRFYGYHVNHKVYYELMDYTKMRSDATKRNRIFFDKLNLVDIH